MREFMSTIVQYRISLNRLIYQIAQPHTSSEDTATTQWVSYS